MKRKLDPNGLIDGDPAPWIFPTKAKSFYCGIRFRGRVNAGRVGWAIEHFCRQFTPRLRWTDVVAFVPRSAWKSVKKQLHRIEKAKPGAAAGMTLCPTPELVSHVVVFALADVELGRTPAPAKYVIYETTPGHRVRHHIVLKRFDREASR